MDNRIRDEQLSELRAECAALARALGDPASAPPPPGFDTIATRLAQERGVAARLRALSTPARLALMGLASLAAAALMLIVGRRPDLGVYPSGRLVLECVALVALAWAPLSRSLRPLGQPERWRALPVVLVAVAVLYPWLPAALPQAHARHPASLVGGGAGLVSLAWPCFVLGLLCSLPTLVVAQALDRGCHRGPGRAALAAAGAGLAGSLALGLHCPITAPLHLHLGHAGIALALVVGWVLVTHRLAPEAVATGR